MESFFLAETVKYLYVSFFFCLENRFSRFLKLATYKIKINSVKAISKLLDLISISLTPNAKRLLNILSIFTQIVLFVRIEFGFENLLKS